MILWLLLDGQLSLFWWMKGLMSDSNKSINMRSMKLRSSLQWIWIFIILMTYSCLYYLKASYKWWGCISIVHESPEYTYTDVWKSIVKLVTLYMAHTTINFKQVCCDTQAWYFTLGMIHDSGGLYVICMECGLSLCM